MTMPQQGDEKKVDRLKARINSSKPPHSFISINEKDTHAISAKTCETKTEDLYCFFLSANLLIMNEPIADVHSVEQPNQPMMFSLFS